MEPTSPSVYIGAPVVGSWTFHDEEALHEEEGIGTWAPVVRSWTFHAEDDPSPRSIASAGLSSPRSFAGLPSPRSIAGLSSPRSDSHTDGHASDASPGIGSWGFGRPKYHRDGVPHKQRQPGAPAQSAQFAPAHVRPILKARAKVAAEDNALEGMAAEARAKAEEEERLHRRRREVRLMVRNPLPCMPACVHMWLPVRTCSRGPFQCATCLRVCAYARVCMPWTSTCLSVRARATCARARCAYVRARVCMHFTYVVSYLCVACVPVCPHASVLAWRVRVQACVHGLRR